MFRICMNSKFDAILQCVISRSSTPSTMKRWSRLLSLSLSSSLSLSLYCRRCRRRRHHREKAIYDLEMIIGGGRKITGKSSEGHPWSTCHLTIQPSRDLPFQTLSPPATQQSIYLSFRHPAIPPSMYLPSSHPAISLSSLQAIPPWSHPWSTCLRIHRTVGWHACISKWADL